MVEGYWIAVCLSELGGGAKLKMPGSGKLIAWGHIITTYPPCLYCALEMAICTFSAAFLMELSALILIRSGHMMRLVLVVAWELRASLNTSGSR